MNVFIVERKTKKVVAEQVINLQGLNYVPSEQEYFNQAGQCAVEDGIVAENELERYEFRIAK